MNYLIVSLGYVIDLIFSDPVKLTHPVVIIGNLINGLEKLLYKENDGDRNKLIKGALLNIIVLVLTFLVVFFIVRLSLSLNLYLYFIVSAILVSFTISTEGLKKAAMEIYELLAEKNIEEARYKVGMIVGRDTQNLTEEEISRAVIETVAENIVDGVTSPLFYGLIGGAPLAFLYRAVNTMDSMLGYKNDKYLYFGRFSARLDDLMNFVPARLTSLLIILVAYLHPRMNGKNALRAVIDDASKHPSPNGGYTESAAAGALEIRLGGYNYYFGQKSFRAYMGKEINSISANKIAEVVEILYMTTFVWVLFTVIIGFII